MKPRISLLVGPGERRALRRRWSPARDRVLTYNVCLPSGEWVQIVLATEDSPRPPARSEVER